MIMIGSAAAFSQGAEIYHQPSSVEVNVGDTFTVDVKFDPGVTVISALELRMQYDSQFLEIIEVSNELSGSYNTFIEPTYSNGTGEIGIAAMKFDNNQPAENPTIMRITFLAVQATGMTEVTHNQNQFPKTALAFAGENKLTAIEDLGVHIIPGEALNIDPEKDNDDLGLAVWPNPIESNGNISFQFSGEEKRVNLGIYDMNGRLVRTVFAGVVNPQVENKYEVDFSGFASGNYICRLTAGGTAQSKVIVIGR